MPKDVFRVQIDTAFLKYNVNHKDFYEHITSDIPQFLAYEEGTQPFKVRLFAWIVCMYDMNSPLRKETPDLYKRKVHAASLTGINPHKLSGKYKENIEKILLGKDDVVNGLVTAFIASFASPEYMQLLAHMSIQHTAMNKIISGTHKPDDQKMFDAATDKIKSLTNLLYGTGERDEVYEARRALYQQAGRDLSSMRPENVAKMMVEDGGLPGEWNPYEHDYEVGDINFVSDDPSIAAADEEELR